MCAPGLRPKRGRRGPGRLHAGSDPAEGAWMRARAEDPTHLVSPARMQRKRLVVL